MVQSLVVIRTQYLSPLDRRGTVRSIQYCLGGLSIGHFIFFGGGDQDRTDYLLTASQALYQVSYAPVCILVPPPCTDQGTNPYHGFGMPFTYRGMFIIITGICDLPTG